MYAILSLLLFCFVLALLFAVFRSVVFRVVCRECSTCDLRKICDEEGPEVCNF